MKVLARDTRELGVGPSYRDRLAETGAVIDRDEAVPDALLPTQLYSYLRPSNGQRVWAYEIEARADVDAWTVTTIVLDGPPEPHHLGLAIDPGAVAGVDLDDTPGGA